MHPRVSASTVAALFVALGGGHVALADHVPLGAIEPDADEQAGIYDINRARNDPTAYGDEIGLDLSSVSAQPPLAVNGLLSGAARFHAQLMLDHHEYGHVSTLLGIGPNQMAVNNGYDLFGMGLDNSWTTVNTIESIMRSVNQVATATAAVKALIIDKDVPGAGHRVHLLAISSYGDHREIGFGWAAGKDAFPEFGLPKSLPTKLCSILTAHRDTSNPFLTGVVFQDRNGNLRYDKGEGIGGATVSVDGGGSTTSMATGGWSLPVNPGTRIVRCSGGTFSGAALALVTVGSSNIEVDFHSGRTTGEVDFAWREGVVAPGPNISIGSTSDIGPAPHAVTLTGSGAGGGFYSWDLANGDTESGTQESVVYAEPGLYPVILLGLDSTGSGSALRLILVSDDDGAGEGTTDPGDETLHLTKALAKRKITVAGKDQVKATGTLELPGGLSPEGLQVQVCVAGVLRTFTLDAKGKSTLPDKSKFALTAKWPKDGTGIAAGTIAKFVATLKGDLATPLEAAGLRNRTETRTVENVPCAVLLGGFPYRIYGSMATKAVAGKTAAGTITVPAE
jgi:hypothetical protein